MSTRLAGLIVVSAFLATAALTSTVAVQAHHAVAGIYDLNKEVVLEGRLKKLNFTNPHASIELEVPAIAAVVSGLGSWVVMELAAPEALVPPQLVGMAFSFLAMVLVSLYARPAPAVHAEHGRHH